MQMHYLIISIHINSLDEIFELLNRQFKVQQNFTFPLYSKINDSATTIVYNSENIVNVSSITFVS